MDFRHYRISCLEPCACPLCDWHMGAGSDITMHSETGAADSLSAQD